MQVISFDELIRLGITPQDIARLSGRTETKKSKDRTILQVVIPEVHIICEPPPEKSKVYFIYDLGWGRYQGVFSTKEKALEGVKQYLGDSVEIIYNHAYGGGWNKDSNYVIEYRFPNGGFGYMYIDVWEIDKVATEPPHGAGDET